MELALELIAQAKRTRATRLDLGRCGLTELPEALFELTWLEELILSDAWWEYSFERKGKYRQESLNKGKANNIKFLSPKMKLLRGLKKLIVSGWSERWELSDLSPLKELTNLQQLYVSNTQVSDLSPLKELTNLQQLYVYYTKVSNLSPLKELTNLQLLNVSNTKVSDLSPLKELMNLQLLYVYNTKVSDLSPLKELTNLQLLSVNSTQVSDLSPLKELTNLQLLSVNSTQVSDLSPLKELTNLQLLNVNSTQVSDLSPLKELTNLQLLNVNNTQVSDLSSLNINFIKKTKIYQSPNKEQKNGIFIHNCPITIPPKEIIEQGDKALLNYWEQIDKQGGLDDINEAKLIIVGEGGSGKTTLFEKLKDPSHNPLKTPTPETHGINILEGLVMYRDFRANLWDFGGQELQYMTHQFFLTPRALYVLMMDARNESPNLTYWFKIISLLGRDSDSEKVQILLVFNKRAGTTGTPQYEDILMYYKDDLDYKFLEIDFAEDDFHWLFLKNNIEQRLSKLSIKLPKQWKPIRNALREESLRNPHISIQRFSEICSLNGVPSEEDQWYGSATLHKLGQILHYQDEKGLRSHIILSPKWAVNGVYSFVENEGIKKNNGRFSEQQFLDILAQKNYKRADADLILQLMTRNHFDICYKSKGGDNYVAAQLLPDNRPPQYKWHPEAVKGGALQFRYQYPTMPKGLISRLIVRLSDHIEVIEGVEVVWKKGAILRFEKDGHTCRVLIREDDAESKTSLRQIIIDVMGEGKYKKFALQKVRDEVEDLHKKWFRNIHADEVVPCCCEKCRYSETPKSYLLKDLLELWQESSVRQCTTGKLVQIQHLLEGVYDKEEVEALYYDGKEGRQYLNKREKTLETERIVPDIHVHIENKPQFTNTVQNNGLKDEDTALLKELLAKLSDEKKESLKTFVETLPEPEDEGEKKTYGKQIIKWLDKNAESIVGNVAASAYYDVLKHLLGI